MQDKTPDFDNGYEKIKDYWAEFVAYKKSEDALKKSATNKMNAGKKKYHHIMGPGGYGGNMAKWKALEASFLENKYHSRALKMDRMGKKLVLRAWGLVGRRKEGNI